MAILNDSNKGWAETHYNVVAKTKGDGVAGFPFGCSPSNQTKLSRQDVPAPRSRPLLIISIPRSGTRSWSADGKDERGQEDRGMRGWGTNALGRMEVWH